MGAERLVKNDSLRPTTYWPSKKTLAVKNSELIKSNRMALSMLIIVKLVTRHGGPMVSALLAPERAVRVQAPWPERSCSRWS